VGIEALGSDDPALDSEAILLLHNLLEAVGVRDVRLRLASLGSGEVRTAYRAELQRYLQTNIDRLSQEVRARIDLNPLRAFDSDDPNTQAVMEKAPRLLDWLSPQDAEHFKEVQALLDIAGVPYEIDSTLVRGLDYYTRTLFEFTSDALGAQSGVGGGGRYDGLVEELGGPATPAVGWAAGVERMLLATGMQLGKPSAPDLYVAYTNPQLCSQAFLLCIQARQAGFAAQVELAGRGLKGQLKQADRLGAKWLALLEGANIVALKHMESGKQRSLPYAEVLAEIAPPSQAH
jgi:histidyl-tRNA synthetase